ncbi:hypothetical protein TorRG33x02_318920 [Trema orientale]|uniref:Uncharacterized protein n=1 Tax=Trema orientale TaxID=63057 RepID=A0A2P5BJD1_TREOI|nr:hypothetical protein TorRG33x02_318920 [Trema orientale]
MGISSYTKRRINKLITIKFLSIPLFSQQPNRLKRVQNRTQYNNPTIHTNLITILKIPHQQDHFYLDKSNWTLKNCLRGRTLIYFPIQIQIKLFEFKHQKLFELFLGKRIKLMRMQEKRKGEGNFKATCYRLSGARR